MFIGHFAVGLAAKRWAPRTSLGLLIAAPLFLDLLWPIFLVTGLETVRIAPGDTAFTSLEFVSYPFSHSLVMALVWSAILAGGYQLLRGEVRGARMIALGVFSHWVFDFLTHRPDLPLVPGLATKVGLGLWNHVQATLAVEGAIFAAGVWIYASSTRGRGRAGFFALWSFVLVLLAMYLGTAFGPPPPSERSLGWLSLGLWVFPLWGSWIDRSRVLVGAAQRAATRP